jgi:hypothetical protein
VLDESDDPKIGPQGNICVNDLETNAVIDNRSSDKGNVVDKIVRFKFSLTS